MKKILSIIASLLLISNAAFGANTPNKGYNNQTTGTNASTWGIVLNSNFSTIDSNLGGTLTLSVAGSSNVTLSLAQAENLIYNFTGVLTGNINVIFPAAGGLYFINNQTTGAFTLTVQSGSSINGFLIPQGTQVPIYVDNSTSPPTVGGASGTQYVFSAPIVGGTANALTIASTLPSNFTLSNGTFLTFVPIDFNTGASTLTTPDGNTEPIQKIGATGIVSLQDSDLTPGVPIISQYNGSAWIALNLLYYGSPTQVSSNFTLSFAGLYVPYIATSAINVTLGATTGFGPIFNTQFLAEGGAITLIPDGTDNINGANSNFVIPQGSSGKLTNDGAGNWWVYFSGPPVNSPAFTGTPTAPTAASGTNTTQIATTAFVQGLLASPVFTGTPTAPTAAANTISTQIATTAFANPSNSLGGNGFQKLPSGLIIEWGNYTTTGPSSRLTFPQSFPNNIFNVTATATSSSTINIVDIDSVSPPTTTGVTFRTWAFSTGSAENINWLAIGD